MQTSKTLKIQNNSHLRHLANSIERVLIQGLGRDQIITPQHTLRVERRSDAHPIDGDRDARVLPKRHRSGDAVTVSVEGDGGGEGGGHLEKAGEGEAGDAASVGVGDYALEGAVVGDGGVAQFHRPR